MIVISGTLVQTDNISRVFFIFTKFWFCWLLVGKRAKNDPKWWKILSVTFCNITYTCKMIILWVVFSFFLWIVRGVKRQKMAQNGKKFCLSHSVSKNHFHNCDFSYTCKMMISLASFFIVSKFWFLGFLGGKRAKTT